MATIIKPFKKIVNTENTPSVTIIGPGEPNWWRIVEEDILDIKTNIFYSGRNCWQESWTETTSAPDLTRYIDWEIQAIKKSDILAIYLNNEWSFPISLMHIGMYLKDKTVLIGCDGPFWTDNVINTIKKFPNVQTCQTVSSFAKKIRTELLMVTDKQDLINQITNLKNKLKNDTSSVIPVESENNINEYENEIKDWKNFAEQEIIKIKEMLPNV